MAPQAACPVEGDPALTRCSLSGATPCCSFGAFWMSLAIYTTLAAAGVFTAEAVEGDRLMLTLWGILVSCPPWWLRCACSA